MKISIFFAEILGFGAWRYKRRGRNFDTFWPKSMKNRLEAKNRRNLQKKLSANAKNRQNLGLYRWFFVKFLKNRCLHLLPWSSDMTVPSFPVLIWWFKFSLSWAPSSAFLVLWSDDSQLLRVDLMVQIWSKLQWSISWAFDGPNWIWMWPNDQNWTPMAIWWSNG